MLCFTHEARRQPTAWACTRLGHLGAPDEPAPANTTAWCSARFAARLNARLCELGPDLQTLRASVARDLRHLEIHPCTRRC